MIHDKENLLWTCLFFLSHSFLLHINCLQLNIIRQEQIRRKRSINLTWSFSFSISFFFSRIGAISFSYSSHITSNFFSNLFIFSSSEICNSFSIPFPSPLHSFTDLLFENCFFYLIESSSLRRVNDICEYNPSSLFISLSLSLLLFNTPPPLNVLPSIFSAPLFDGPHLSDENDNSVIKAIHCHNPPLVPYHSDLQWIQ